MRKLDSGLLFVLLVIIVSFFGWLTWASLVWFVGKDVPWYVFLFVFSIYMSIMKKSESGK